jgi:poly-gamma-glutamate capsule biosynthesis protein CapA/YwtB (metallophosphatase superfamily)
MTNKDEKQKDSIKLVAVGYIVIGIKRQLMDGTFFEPIRKDPNSAFPFISPLIKKADIAFFNLESAYSDKGRRANGRISAWCGSPNMVSGIASAGFNLANIANNHIMDYGQEAFLDTLEHLTKHKIAYFGGGRNISEARKPVILERKGTRLAFLGCSTNINQPYGFKAGPNKPGIAMLGISPFYAPPHINEEMLEGILDDIKNAKSLADITIFSCHWSVGMEMGGSHTLMLHQRAACHAAIEAGADLALTHGTHLLQGIEVYKGKVICYNLGQLAVDRDIAIEEKKTIIVNCEISGKRIQKVSFLPVLINEQGQPQPLSSEDEDCHKIQQLMDKLSRKLGTTLSFKGAEGVVKIK